ncbi:aldose 1-epimerase [Ammoniphilus sp. 3BR4]|uniref:aldose 1-epimerase n=1 Tax=Ammoniphilus sp. 3BR4 TaxID=3158265 RepID=UPI003466AD2F
MSTFVEQITYLGEPAVQASNEQMEIIIVPGWGSNLISCIHKESNYQVLRVPDSLEEYGSNPYLFGTPVLFPPNRIGDGTFEFNGRTYHLEINEKGKNNHLHGFVHDKRWELVKAEAQEDRVVVETEMDSSHYPDIFEQFPHHFVIRMTYMLEGATLHKNATIRNKGTEPFPWGLGYHTTFFFPEDQSSFSLTADKRWLLDERLLPTGELEEMEYKKELHEGIRLKDWALDDAFLSSALSGGRNEASVETAGLKIVYRADEHFKHWVVYNADGRQGFVCPEPYTWVTNAPNLRLPESLTGVQVLGPGDEVTVKTEIAIYFSTDF